MITTLESICNEIVERAQQNIGAYRMIRGKKRRRVSSGKLKDSLTYSITKGQRTTKVKFGASGSASKYADVIERGRRPNRKPPPEGEIYQWLINKRIRMRGPKGGFVKETPTKLHQLARTIAFSIGVHGIEGIHYFEEAVEDVMKERGEELAVALAEELRIKIMNTKWQ